MSAWTRRRAFRECTSSRLAQFGKMGDTSRGPESTASARARKSLLSSGSDELWAMPSSIAPSGACGGGLKETAMFGILIFALVSVFEADVVDPARGASLAALERALDALCCLMRR